jgi:hypothetical protein
MREVTYSDFNISGIMYATLEECSAVFKFDVTQATRDEKDIFLDKWREYVFNTYGARPKVFSSFCVYDEKKFFWLLMKYSDYKL